MTSPDEMETPAMIVAGERINRAQLDVGVEAMCGEFRAWQVRRALSRAGVTNVDRAADRLMQSERKAGRIRAINNKVWKATSHD